jgi:hypothetical protein
MFETFLSRTRSVVVLFSAGFISLCSIGTIGLSKLKGLAVGLANQANPTSSIIQRFQFFSCYARIHPLPLKGRGFLREHL